MNQNRAVTLKLPLFLTSYFSKESNIRCASFNSNWSLSFSKIYCSLNWSIFRSNSSEGTYSGSKRVSLKILITVNRKLIATAEINPTRNSFSRFKVDVLFLSRFFSSLEGFGLLDNCPKKVSLFSSSLT